MISSKKVISNGINKRFLSDFIIKSEQHVRVFNYVYDPINGSDIENIIDTNTGLYIRKTDIPTSDDLVSLEKWDLVNNSILFYVTPKNEVRIYLEVATTPEEFGGTISLPAVELSEIAAAEARTAADEAEAALVEMKLYYMGAYSENPTANMVEGSMYFNTVKKYIYIYSGFDWLSLNSMIKTTIKREQFTSVNGPLTFVLSNEFNVGQNELTVVINGITQDTSSYTENNDNSITLNEELVLNDNMEITITQNVSLNQPNLIDYIDNKTIYKSVKEYGALGNSIDNDTTAIQDTINYVSSLGGGTVYIPNGIYMITSLFLKSNVLIKGESRDSVIIKSIAGTNADMIVSYNYATEDLQSGGIVDLQLNGNYFANNWNATTATYNNTSGGGVRVRGYGLVFDIGLYNIAGIGFLAEEPLANENTSAYHKIGELTIDGRDFGKEGVIIKGPNDWIIKQVFIGRAGILGRPNADTEISYSTYYGGTPVSAVVFDGVNLEIGTMHIYANWSGCGFETKGVCRLTSEGRVISESNRTQVLISSETYGSCNFDVRNIGLLHPNWTATIPTQDDNWSAVIINSDKLTSDITLMRTITSTNRVVGTTGLLVNSGATINFRSSNNTAPTGDTEAGTLYSGTGVKIAGNGGIITANVDNNNGMAIYLFGSNNNVTFNIKNNIGGSAFLRNSGNNGLKGNIISGNLQNCSTSFNSIGTPTSENINLSIESFTGQTVFAGEAPNYFNRSQIWNISASLDNQPLGSRSVTSYVFDTNLSTVQTFSVPHKMIFTPNRKNIELRGYLDIDNDDTAILDYLKIVSIDSDNINFEYLMTTAATGSRELVIKID